MKYLLMLALALVLGTGQAEAQFNPVCCFPILRLECDTNQVNVIIPELSTAFYAHPIYSQYGTVNSVTVQIFQSTTQLANVTVTPNAVGTTLVALNVAHSAAPAVSYSCVLVYHTATASIGLSTVGYTPGTASQGCAGSGISWGSGPYCVVENLNCATPTSSPATSTGTGTNGNSGNPKKEKK